MPNFKSYNVNLHILSPVHIGAGQELDPFSYLIKNEDLLLFDLLKWVDGYENREELNGKMDSEDYIALRAYIAKNFNDDNAILSSIPVKSPDVITRYKKAMKDKNSENQALINFMTMNEITRVPYIPGSSIKGAIRTAIASRFVSKAHVTKYDKKKYNKKIFGNPSDDPMKNLKISDASLNSAGSFIYDAKEYSRKPDKSLTPKGGFEASASLCELESPVIIPLHFSLNNFKLFGESIDLNFLVNTLDKFYMPKYKADYEKFYGASKKIQQAIAYLNMAAVKLNTNETFIRIGHFSHIECVTLDHARDPRTGSKHGRPLPWGTTRTLANGLYPFGWAKLEFRDLPANPRQDRDWPFSIEGLERDIKSREDAKIIAANQRKKARKEQITRKKQQAERDSMTPEEKMIKEVKDPRVTENRVFAIYHTMDTFPGDKKRTLAEVLKNYWQQKNKWRKKKCSARQWEKVQKIKQILQEN